MTNWDDVKRELRFSRWERARIWRGTRSLRKRYGSKS